MAPDAREPDRSKMDEAAILQAISEVASRHLEWDGELRPEMDLVQDLELDSLRLLTLAAEVENRFEICLEEDDEAGLATVADLVSVVQRKLRMQPGGPASEGADDA